MPEELRKWASAEVQSTQDTQAQLQEPAAGWVPELAPELAELEPLELLEPEPEARGVDAEAVR